MVKTTRSWMMMMMTVGPVQSPLELRSKRGFKERMAMWTMTPIMKPNWVP